MNHMVHGRKSEEAVMSLHNRINLFALSLIIWIVGSIYYVYRGPQVLETTKLHYWVSFFVSPLFSAILVVIILKLLRIAPSD